MDLRYYVSVLWRGRRLAALVTALTALISLGLALFTGRGYKIETELLVSPLSNPSTLPANLQYDPAYYAELTSEYILDDFTEVLRQRTFANQISQALHGAVKPTELKNQIVANRVHRILKVEATLNGEQKAREVGAVIDQLILKEAPTYFTGQHNNQVVTATVIEPPTLVQKPSLIRTGAFWFLRTLVGLAAGVALVFVVRYFDPNLYDEWDVSRELGVPVLASIPRASRGDGSFRRRPFGRAATSVQPRHRTDEPTPGEAVASAGRGR